ncbi:hypothetical protein GCM10009107_46260 [Ideonella azotifigens]|uniref:OmpR/PhoB-type domain-containing protein n=1 Tax=Ideonella azotifigens TaxID=513160 RepID=A0ABN1KCS7_9BURK
MLLHLIEHCGRVVGKEELLNHLWHGRVVSEGVLARSVMQARKAIGDEGGEEALIKTIHKVGYRFVGSLLPAAAAPLPSATQQRRVAVLPIENRTGETRFDWISLGLAALVCNALSGRVALAVVDLNLMLFELGQLPADMGSREKADALRQRLGADCVLQSVLRWQGNALWLAYQCTGEVEAGPAGTLRGDEPSEMALRMAAEVAQGLCPQGAVPLVPESQDPFVNQVIGRGTQLAAQYQFRAAAKFFEVVLELEPRNSAAQLEYLRSLTNGEDPRALEVGTALLSQAREVGDERLQAIVHLALGHALLMGETRGAIPNAVDHLAQSIRSASAVGAPDILVRARLGQAMALRLQGDVPRAEAALNALHHELSTVGGSRLHLSLVKDNLAVVEAEQGHLLKARNLLDEVLLLNRAHGLRSAASLTLMNLARINAGLGCLALARSQAAESEQGFDSLQQPHAAASIAEAAAEVYGELGLVRDLDRVLERLAPLCERAGLPPKSQWLTARARREMCAGRAEAAGALFKRTVAMAQRSQAHLRLRYRQLWRLEMSLRFGDVVAAEARLAQLAELPAVLINGELQSAMARARAALAFRLGHAEQALKHLEDAVSLAPAGRWRAMALMDAAWMDLTAGRTGQAQMRLRALSPWLDEHPLGRALNGQSSNGRFVLPHTSTAADIEWLLPSLR